MISYLLKRDILFINIGAVLDLRQHVAVAGGRERIGGRGGGTEQVGGELSFP